MSSLHNAIPDGALSLALRRMFGGDSQLSVERLSETLQPIVNPWEHAFCAYLRNERLWACTAIESADAANFSWCGIVNPADSGMLVEIHKAYVRTSGTLDIAAGLIDAATVLANDASTAAVTVRDTRWSRGATFAARSTLHQGSHAAISFINALERITFAAGGGSEEFMNLPAVLHPGFAYVVEGQTVNIAIRCNFSGTERPAVTGELV